MKPPHPWIESEWANETARAEMSAIVKRKSKVDIIVRFGFGEEFELHGEEKERRVTCD